MTIFLQQINLLSPLSETLKSTTCGITQRNCIGNSAFVKSLDHITHHLTCLTFIIISFLKIGSVLTDARISQTHLLSVYLLHIEMMTHVYERPDRNIGNIRVCNSRDVYGLIIIIARKHRLSYYKIVNLCLDHR